MPMASYSRQFIWMSFAEFLQFSVIVVTCFLDCVCVVFDGVQHDKTCQGSHIGVAVGADGAVLGLVVERAFADRACEGREAGSQSFANCDYVGHISVFVGHEYFGTPKACLYLVEQHKSIVLCAEGCA